jgi:hypothetical protein
MLTQIVRCLVTLFAIAALPALACSSEGSPPPQGTECQDGPDCYSGDLSNSDDPCKWGCLDGFCKPDEEHDGMTCSRLEGKIGVCSAGVCSFADGG